MPTTRGHDSLFHLKFANKLSTCGVICSHHAPSRFAEQIEEDSHQYSCHSDPESTILQQLKFCAYVVEKGEKVEKVQKVEKVEKVDIVEKVEKVEMVEMVESVSEVVDKV